MRRIFGLAIVGGALIGLSSGAKAQVTVSTGNGTPGTQVMVGQPYANGSPGYSTGYVQNAQAPTTVYRSGYRGYRAPRVVKYDRSRYVPAQTTYYRTSRPAFVGKRHGRGMWHRPGHSR